MILILYSIIAIWLLIVVNFVLFEKENETKEVAFFTTEIISIISTVLLPILIIF